MNHKFGFIINCSQEQITASIGSYFINDINLIYALCLITLASVR